MICLSLWLMSLSFFEKQEVNIKALKVCRDEQFFYRYFLEYSENAISVGDTFQDLTLITETVYSSET